MFNSMFILGLDHDANVKKMRFLTFLLMSETQSEMSFELLQQELMIGPEEVEPFIIAGKCYLKYFCLFYL